MASGLLETLLETHNRVEWTVQDSGHDKLLPSPPGQEELWC